MLKISQPSDGEPETLRVEGKLLGAWVHELAEACAGRAAAGLRLDLSELTFVNDEGAALLRELIARGAEVCACSGYVAAILGWRRP